MSLFQLDFPYCLPLKVMASGQALKALQGFDVIRRQLDLDDADLVRMVYAFMMAIESRSIRARSASCPIPFLLSSLRFHMMCGVDLGSLVSDPAA